jgi:hypothetical protein
MLRPLHIALSVVSSVTLHAKPTGNPEVVLKTPNLVAFWDFAEEPGQPRVSKGTEQKHALLEVMGKTPRVEGGPYSGFSTKLDGRDYLRVPRKDIGNLDIHGRDAQVTLFTVIRVDEMKKGITVAGIWSEGKGANDDSGTRQYSLLLNMGMYGGPKRLVPHISSEGGVTRRADGSAFPWCADYAVNHSEIPVGKWVTLGSTYDGKYLRAYFNGVMEERKLDPVKDRRNDPYFITEGPDGKDRGMNPYYHGRGIFTYDPDKHAQSKPDGAADFTVGACYAGSRGGNPLIGLVGGIAVFDRALTDAEMKALHDSANIEQLK